MVYQTDSPEWRTFASHEMTALGFDFDLGAQPSQIDAANRLLEEDEQERPTGEVTQDSTSLHRSSADSSLVYSDGTAPPSIPSSETVNDFSAQGSSSGDHFPTKAQTHGYWKGNAFYALTWEFLGILVSICFLILGAFVVDLKGQQETEWSLRVIQATRIAPSLWPVLFSGVLGNAVRALADWRVEHGLDLMALEQLMGSLTLAGSLITMFKWSVIRISSVALLLLWAFNPLGSQSSFRGIYLRGMEGSGTGDISYYNYNLSTQLAMTGYVSGSTRVRPKIRALWSGALYDAVSTTQYVDKTNTMYRDIAMMLGGERSAAVQAATDAWGNLRIPNLQVRSDYDSSDPHRWLDIPWLEAVQNYSGLVGDRIEGVDRNFTGNTTFNITSSYQRFSCSPWIGFDFNGINRWLLDTLGKNYSEMMSREPWAPMDRTFFVASSNYSSMNTFNGSSEDHPRLIFGTLGDTHYMSVTECSTHMTYVDANVLCISKGSLGKADCGVNSIRETLNPTDPTELTLLESRYVRYPNTPYHHDPDKGAAFMQGFMDLLDDIQSASSILEWYMKDPLTALNEGRLLKYANLEELDIRLFEQRFSLLWNTLWKITIEWDSLTGGNMTQEKSFDTLINTTSTTTFPLPAVYALDVPWIIIYFVSVAIMLFAAVFSLVMHHRCHAPPILGYVSSLIRDSKYFDDETQGNSAENGTGKTKRLQDIKVMIADIRVDEDVGKMAFVSASGEARVKSRRWYE